MRCRYHNENEANSICKCCGEAVCNDCGVDLEGKIYCKKCMSRVLNISSEKRRPKSKFLSLCFSLMPGGGHMYLGLINKGIQIMCAFFGIIFIGMLASEIMFTDFFATFTVIAACATFIFYSFFDTLRCVNDINSGLYIQDTKLVVSFSSIEEFILKAKGSQKIIGYAFLSLGGLGILNIFIRFADDYVRRFFNYRYYFSLSNIIFPVLMMIVGLYLLRKNNTNSNTDSNTDSNTVSNTVSNMDE